MGKNPPNDPLYIARALQVGPENRHNIGRALGKLVVSGFLILSNQQIEEEFAPRDVTRQDEAGQEQKHAPASPSPRSKEPSLWVDAAEFLEGTKDLSSKEVGQRVDAIMRGDLSVPLMPGLTRDGNWKEPTLVGLVGNIEVYDE